MSGREPGRKTEETGHDYVRDRLSEYLDGQLLGQERQAVEEHLAACGSCRWELQTLRQTVLWTRNLPTMPVPRSFTLPVPAAVPARSARPRWRLVPAFQLATAMVALLLFFAVAGDMALTGMRPASMPAPSLMQREAGEQAVETVVVEAEAPEETMALQAVPAEPEPESAAEKAAEGAARMLATEVPLLEEAPMAAAAAPEVTAVPDLAATQTAAPPGMGGGLPDFEDTPLPPSEEPGATTHAVPETVSDRPPETPGIAAEVPVTVEAAEPVVEAEATEEMAAMALPEPEVSPAPQAAVPPQPLATPVPPLAAPGEENLSGPEVEVQVEEPLEALAASEPSAGDLGERAGDEVRDAHALQGQATNWLRLIQYALAALLVLLVGTTAALMVWRRRAE
jgi:anti-sigma factor RsiW